MQATITVHCLIVSLLIGLASAFCPTCPTSDTSDTVCAAQLLSPHVKHTFTQCQLSVHNCVMSLNKYTQVGFGACPVDGYTAETCAQANACDNTFQPVCGESLVTKRKQRFTNVCHLHLASCLAPHDPLFNLGNMPCKNWLNI